VNLTRLALHIVAALTIWALLLASGILPIMEAGQSTPS
jgi:hypothetical protein